MLTVFATLFVGFVGVSIFSNDSYADESNVALETEATITNDNGTISDDVLSITESEDYVVPMNFLQTRAVGHMVYRNATVVKSNGAGIFAGSIYYSKQERGYTTPFTGTLYRTRAWSQNNGSYMVYFAEYKGTVSAYLGW